MHQELKQRHVPLILSAFLVKYRREQDRATLLDNADIAFYYMPWMTIEGLLDVMDLYHEALSRYAQAEGIAFVADREAVPANSQHFADCVHLTDAGCAAMADRFARFFAESQVIDKALAQRRQNK